MSLVAFTDILIKRNIDALFKVPMLKSTPIAAVDDIPGFSGFNAGVIVYQVRKITL